MVTDVGAERANGTSESWDSGSALGPVVGRVVTTVAVTVVTEGTFWFAQFGPPPGGPHRSNEVRSRPKSWCIPSRRTRRMSERRVGATDAVARRKVDGDNDSDQGVASFPLLPRGRV